MLRESLESKRRKTRLEPMMPVDPVMRMAWVKVLLDM